jgi:ABC-type polysaccharide/polyol phosphate export permease
MWREWTFFKHRFIKITSSQLISPLLYLITFGIGLSGVVVEGKSYLHFIIPGLLAMTSTRSSYASVSMRISITRLHERSLECYIYSPTRMSHFALGYIFSGALRGFYAGLFTVLIGVVTGSMTWSVMLFVVMMINSIIFSSIGFIAAMTIDTHYDLNRFTSMVITPMTFLCGTFYSVSGLPWYFKSIIELFPLTHTTRLIRRLFFGYGLDGFSLLIALVYMVILLLLSIRICYEEIK